MCLVSDPPSILIIDDDPLMRWALVQSMRQGGFTVTEASTGQGTLAMCSASTFDILLLDRFLPDLDAFTILGQVKAYGPDQTVIMLTGLNAPGVESKALALGAYKLLIKPVDLAIVLALVQTVIAAKAASGC